MPYGMCLSLSSLLRWQSLGPSVLLQTVLSHSFYGWVVFHIVLIHSTVDRHLGSFHVLVITNSAAMNIEMHVFFWIMVSLDICPGVRLQDHLVALFLIFLGNVFFIMGSWLSFNTVLDVVSLSWIQCIFFLILLLLY